MSEILEAARRKMQSAVGPETTAEAIREYRIIENKVFRLELDGILVRMQQSPIKSRQRSIAITHLEDVNLRLGLDLKDAGAPNPYPNSKDPSNTIVDPTAPEVAKGFAPEGLHRGPLYREPHYGADKTGYVDGLAGSQAS